MILSDRKSTFGDVRLTKIQSTSASAQFDQSSLPACRHYASMAFQNALSEDSDQTVNAHCTHMPEGIFSVVVANMIEWDLLRFFQVP